MGHDRVGVAGGKLAAAWRTARLGNDRPLLHARPGIQRTAGVVPASLEISGMDLGVVDQNAALRIGDDRPGLPRAPQPVNDVHVLVGHVVAQIVLGHSGHAEIHRRVVRTPGHHVPSSPPRRHLIERRHQPREQIGRVGIGSECRNDADARGRGHHQTRNHRRVLARHSDAVLQVDLGRPGPALADIGRIFEQHIIEAGPLKCARHIDE